MVKRLPEPVDLDKIEVIQQAIAASYNLRRFELLKRTNDRQTTEARQIGLYLAKRFTSCTNDQIAKAFLYAQENSVFQAVGIIRERVNQDTKFKEWVLSIAREFATIYKVNYLDKGEKHHGKA